ncbi:MAG TPA: HAMP domain-containing sensor histidine kinase [Actinomycetota bacterium]|nr:HAMP domain-containing sensor histidine kinase [Actinomycetota bacterium]
MVFKRWFDARAPQVWAAKVAAVFFVGGGVLFLATLPLAPDDGRDDISAAIALMAVVIGCVVWFVPWERLPRRATLALVPPGFALIAGGNIVGGTDYFTYGVFFVIAFVWIGLAHPPFTSLAFAPLAVLAYLVPIPTLPEADRATAAASALISLPIAVLTGEILARGIDRQAKVEAELRRTREVADDLRELEAMKDRFLRAASHEFRTPLAICRGHLDVLSEHPDGTEVGETVRLVTDELDRMARLVEDVTAISRIDDPRSIHPERVAVRELVRSVGATARPLFRTRSLVVAEAAEGDVLADRQRLTQALLALLDNAATHARDATTVELRATADGGGWRFAVVDDGRGIDVGNGDPFEPFGHRATSPGAGLGLAVVRAIAEAHGGSAGFRRDRTGTEFFIRVPACEVRA